MRFISPIIAALAFTALSAVPATAQEAAQELSLTGCLAEETDGDAVEYVLTGIESDAIDAAEVELIPGDGVDLAPHVGHTVEAVGVVMAEHSEMEEHEEGEAGMEHADEKALRVTQLNHIAASCEEGGTR